MILQTDISFMVFTTCIQEVRPIFELATCNHLFPCIGPQMILYHIFPILGVDNCSLIHHDSTGIPFSCRFRILRNSGNQVI